MATFSSSSTSWFTLRTRQSSELLRECLVLGAHDVVIHATLCCHRKSHTIRVRNLQFCPSCILQKRHLPRLPEMERTHPDKTYFNITRNPVSFRYHPPHSLDTALNITSFRYGSRVPAHLLTKYARNMAEVPEE